MSGISKTIEQVKEYKENFERYRSHKSWNAFEAVASSCIMPIITAYEESQRNVVHKNELLDWLQGEHNKANADLDTANKRIDYLEKCNDYYEGNRITHPSKEQTDNTDGFIEPKE